MAFPPTCRINRYYDPSTDSFISVDPAVQSTDQPYVFVNGDPLNATDPLGLEADKTALLANEAAAARCKDHPEANGCRGIDVLGDVATFVTKHIGDIATGAAVLVCVGTAGTGCAAATAVAVAARVYQRHEEGNPYFSTSNILDAGITLASGGLLGGAANIGEGVFSNSSSAWTYVYRLHTAAPDILGWIVGTATHKDVP